MRELVQRLDPNFEPDLLRRHVEAMKQRAVMRLGADFAELLGSAHSFESFNTELLARYVCSGDFAGKSPLGQYADITKQADLYFDQGPFAFPVTLTDTPGTNDPFLIRDEITRRSLESADLYIVVLTARQPLSDADVNLMRLMHGLNSERIIVFVNRVDDFADVGYDLAEVLMYVEKKLEANFPGARIPIVAGSAALGQRRAQGDDETLHRLMQRSSLGYLADIGLVQPQDLTQQYVLRGEQRRILLTTAATLKTTVGDGKLSGVKLPVTDGDIANLALVLAKENGKPGLFLVDLDGGRDARGAEDAGPDAGRGAADVQGRRAGAARRRPGEGHGAARAGDRPRRGAAGVRAAAAPTAASRWPRLCAGALRVRPADRLVPGDQAQAGRMYVTNELARSNAYYGAWALTTDARRAAAGGRRPRACRRPRRSISRRRRTSRPMAASASPGRWTATCSTAARSSWRWRLARAPDWKDRLVDQLETRNAA